MYGKRNSHICGKPEHFSVKFRRKCLLISCQINAADAVSHKFFRQTRNFQIFLRFEMAHSAEQNPRLYSEFLLCAEKSVPDASHHILCRKAVMSRKRRGKPNFHIQGILKGRLPGQFISACEESVIRLKA